MIIVDKEAYVPLSDEFLKVEMYREACIVLLRKRDCVCGRR
jgi:hypothetical protein